MTERPIIFCGPMVRSIIIGNKTQTRRVASDQSVNHSTNNPYGHAGDILWVKETWRTLAEYDDLKPTLLPKHIPIEFKADLDKDIQPEMSKKWRTSLFMPKSFARLLLEIREVRYERIMSCSQIDAVAEGVSSDNSNPVIQYKEIWENINGSGSWHKNPWVWVIGFKSLNL